MRQNKDLEQRADSISATVALMRLSGFTKELAQKHPPELVPAKNNLL
jgi:hypothetical protein